MFKRDIQIELDKWKFSDQRKPLLLRGARQVGKTTVVNEFGKTFDNYLHFNLERHDHRMLFESGMTMDNMVEQLFLFQGERRKSGKTLIFLDEIQNSAQAITLLRYFFEDRPDLYVIAAGSLLESVVDVNFSFPVGRVQYLPVRPCSFKEFIGALGKDNLLSLADDPRLSSAVHTELLTYFNRYLLVGGMPAAVASYVKKRDILSLDGIYETLLQAYRDDTEKYAKKNKLSEVVRFILEYGWSMAGDTITLNGFARSSYRSREIGEAFRLLEKAMLLELVYPSTHAEMPSIPELKRHPKLIWLDTGLVNYAAQIRNDIIGAADILDIWKGRIAEHLVAQELLTLNYKISQRRMFWLKGNGGESAEVDFLWTVDSVLIPIEVKAGRNSHLRSLHSFIDASPYTLAVRIWSGPFSVDEVQTTIKKKAFRLINLPFYLISKMEKIVREYL